MSSEVHPELKHLIGECQTLIDVLSDEVIILDTDYNIVACNRAKVDRFPTCRVGAKCYEVFERRTEPCPICAGREAMSTGKTVRLPEHAITENGLDWNGVPFVNDISAAPLSSSDGEVMGCIEMVRDVSQSYHQKRRLEHLSEEYKKVAYVLSHDLLAPLISIQGFVRKLEKKFSEHLDEKALHYFGRINSNVLFMDQLIKSMLDTSRIVNQDLQMKHTDMQELVRHVLLQFATDVEVQHVQVTVEEGLPKVYCDPVRISQVFANFMSNALKFGRDTNPLKIRIGYDSGAYFFEDNGPGITADMADEVFKPFARGNAEIEGLGMGLSIVYEIIDKHQGTVWLDTHYTDGARFCFTLPRRNGG